MRNVCAHSKQPHNGRLGGCVRLHERERRLECTERQERQTSALRRCHHHNRRPHAIARRRRHLLVQRTRLEALAAQRLVATDCKYYRARRAHCVDRASLGRVEMTLCWRVSPQRT